MHTEQVIAAARQLCEEMEALSFSAPVAYTYNPLTYAWAGHEAYIRRFAGGQKDVLYLGIVFFFCFLFFSFISFNFGWLFNFRLWLWPWKFNWFILS